MTDNRYGVCGVYCGQCPNGNGRVRFTAGELKGLIDTVRYDWMDEVVKSFSFKEFRRGLEWFSQAQCRGCLAGDGAPCKNRPCAQGKRLRSCLLCDSYMTCMDTVYQREWYPFVAENYERVRQVGFDRYLEEEEQRARAGVDLIGYLDRRCCKVVELDERKEEPGSKQ